MDQYLAVIGFLLIIAGSLVFFSGVVNSQGHPSYRYSRAKLATLYILGLIIALGGTFLLAVKW